MIEFEKSRKKMKLILSKVFCIKIEIKNPKKRAWHDLMNIYIYIYIY